MADKRRAADISTENKKRGDRMMTGSQILVQCLVDQGVDTVFGYPGGSVIPLYDVLMDRKEIKHILVRHEQGAAHGADAYARVTGRPGVCIATSGPGATNLVTGIATAYMDSVPLVAITGQVPVPMLGKDSFQEVDITGITLPITKHNYLVKDVRNLSRVIRQAFHIATTGRPGPVLIDVPKDVLTASCKYTYPDVEDMPGYKPTYHGHATQIKTAVEAIRKAKRPVIYAGGGIVSSGAHHELFALAELRSIPVTTTLMGMGGFPGDHPLFMGMLGMHGTATANYAIAEADLVLAVGVRFDDRVTGKCDCFADKATIVHVDIDPAEVGKNVLVDVPIVGDVKHVLSAILVQLDREKNPQWLEQVQTWKKEFPLSYKRNGKIKPQMVIETICDLTKGEAIITTEVGQHQMWAAQHYRYKYPRSFVSSGGLGTMGYGLPATVGAQIGCPDRTVFSIAGDGSFQMNVQELSTAVRYKLPIKICIMNNCYLGMVRQWQEFFCDRRYAFTDISDQPDFVKLAEAYGAVGMRVEKEEDVEEALRQAMAVTDRPVVMDFRVDPDENVFPMIPAGGTVADMILS